MYGSIYAAQRKYPHDFHAGPGVDYTSDSHSLPPFARGTVGQRSSRTVSGTDSSGTSLPRAGRRPAAQFGVTRVTRLIKTLYTVKTVPIYPVPVRRSPGRNRGQRRGTHLTLPQTPTTLPRRHPPGRVDRGASVFRTGRSLKAPSRPGNATVCEYRSRYPERRCSYGDATARYTAADRGGVPGARYPTRVAVANPPAQPYSGPCPLPARREHASGARPEPPKYAALSDRGRSRTGTGRTDTGSPPRRGPVSVRPSRIPE